MKTNLKDLMPHELEAFFKSLGEPAYKVRQLIRWMYVRFETDFEKMTDFSKALRGRLAEVAYIPELTLDRLDKSEEQDTWKFLFRLEDGSLVEAVKMRYLEHLGPGRVAICISSQVGCAMACDFCASGLAGLKRHLSTWEIVDQIVQIQKAVAPLEERVANIVYMGIGEPLHNYENVLRSVRLANLGEGLGIGMRHIAISTSGLVPQIHSLAAEKLPIRLAISLHATNDELRDKIMPVNRRWNLKSLVEACRSYQNATSRRITWEYVMLDEVNDSLEEADELGQMLQGIHSLVNLIPWNAVDGASYQRSRPGRIRAFQERVETWGIKCTVRAEKGADIDAACGQLRLREENLRRRRASV